MREWAVCVRERSGLEHRYACRTKFSAEDLIGQMIARRKPDDPRSDWAVAWPGDHVWLEERDVSPWRPVAGTGFDVVADDG